MSDRVDEVRLADGRTKPIRVSDGLSVVKGIQVAYERGDYEAAFALIDPEIEWIEPDGLPGAGTYRGQDGVREAMIKFWGSWAEPKSEYFDIEEIGDHVLVRLHITAQGKTSGVPGSFDVFQVWTVRDGKAVRMAAYLDEAESHRAAGLRAPTSERTA